MPYTRRMSRSYRKRPYKRNRRGKSARRGASFKQRVRRVVMKQAETKYLTIGGENVQLYHDVGNSSGPSTTQSAFLFNPWSFINKGTDRMNRIGNKLTPRGMSIRLWLANKDDRPNLLYRVIFVVLARTVGVTVPTYNNIDLFKATDVGTNNSTIGADINTEYVKKVLYDRVWSNEKGTSTNFTNGGWTQRESHIFRKIWIKAKRARPIEYLDGNGNYHKNNMFACYVIPYDSWGTLQTDNVASMAFNVKLYWKDI